LLSVVYFSRFLHASKDRYDNAVKLCALILIEYIGLSPLRPTGGTKTELFKVAASASVSSCLHQTRREAVRGVRWRPLARTSNTARPI